MTNLRADTSSNWYWYIKSL